MKRAYLLSGLLLGVILLMGGCGDSVGSPGSSGDTGIIIRAVSSLNADSGDLDVNIHACPPDFTTVEPGLFIDFATVTIDAKNANPDVVNFDAFPASVEMCTITYKKANEDPAAQIIESDTFYPNCILTESETNSCTFPLLDIQRKVDWWNALVDGAFSPRQYPTHYVAVYNCTYVTNYGEKGTFQVEQDIWLADWDLC
jgi:hypothetical protein